MASPNEVVEGTSVEIDQHRQPERVEDRVRLYQHTTLDLMVRRISMALLLEEDIQDAVVEVIGIAIEVEDLSSVNASVNLCLEVTPGKTLVPEIVTVGER